MSYVVQAIIVVRFVYADTICIVGARTIEILNCKTHVIVHRDMAGMYSSQPNCVWASNAGLYPANFSAVLLSQFGHVLERYHQALRATLVVRARKRRRILQR